MQIIMIVYGPMKGLQLKSIISFCFIHDLMFRDRDQVSLITGVGEENVRGLGKKNLGVWERKTWEVWKRKILEL